MREAVMEVETEVLVPEAAVETILQKPRWRGRLHVIAFFVTLPAGFFLLSAAHTTGARVAVAIYWATLAGQFGASASYHRLARTPTATKWLRRLDHSMIFCLIAGTYTPLCILVLPRVWGIPMLVAAWVTALAGIIMKMIRVGTTGNSTGSWLYGVLGGAAVIVLPQLLSELGLVRGLLLFGGGLLYTFGAICLGRKRPDPRPLVFGYHEVWHAFTLAAGACHFVLIALVLS
jgi:hemolysin III